MRVNQWIAQHTDYSRRKADELVMTGRVQINGHTATTGQQVQPPDTVALDGKPIVHESAPLQVVLLHKPAGFVCSRRGQGAPSVYVLLPPAYQGLNIAGRLDKDSSGLVVFTNDGDLLYKLTHPSQQTAKVYTVTLDRVLAAPDLNLITKKGVLLDDGISRLDVAIQPDSSLRITMHEGRNRQIRRTFAALNYGVTDLKRLQHGPYSLHTLAPRQHKVLSPTKTQ